MCSRLGAGFTPGKGMLFLTRKGVGSGSWGFRNGIQYNARFEGLATTWRSLNQNRGIIEMPSFWERSTQFARNDNSIMKLGIIYNKDAEFAVITVPANEVVKPFHHRMPLVLADEDVDKFLEGSFDIHVLDQGKFTVCNPKIAA